MRKLSQSGICTAQMAIVLVVVIVAAGASALVLLNRGPVMNATATVRLHDATTVNLSDYENRIAAYLPPGASIDVSGTFTVNSFSVTDVTVRLHNKTANEWITVAEGQTIADMTQNNDLVAAISSGTYDKVSLSMGTMTLDVSWSEITFNVTNIPNVPDNGFTVPAGSYSGSVTSNQAFELSFATEVVVTAGANQVFDVDVGAPFSPLGILYYLQAGENNLSGSLSLDNANMSARGL